MHMAGGGCTCILCIPPGYATGGGGPKSYDGEKDWSSLNHSLFSWYFALVVFFYQFLSLLNET
jgi:hypothetical protein